MVKEDESFTIIPQRLGVSMALPASLWEGSDRARAELESLLNALRPYVPFLQRQSQPQSRLHHLSERQQAKAKQRGIRALLEASTVVDGISVWRARLLSSVSVIQFGGVAAAAVSALSPQGPGCCDFNSKERVANVITSLPYAAIGLHSMQKRRTAAGKLWGASLLGVSAASITFHSSSGKWRDFGRKLDYWTIAVSSGLLTRALYPRLHPAATAISLTSTPFKPFLVSAANAVAMESKFLQRSFQNPDLRGAQKLHSAACLAGMALFAIEDASVPHVPMVHASWHCLSAWGTALVNYVLADAEDQWPELTLDALTAPGSQAEKHLQEEGWKRSRLDIAPLGIADSSSSSSFLSSSSVDGGMYLQ